MQELIEDLLLETLGPKIAPWEAAQLAEEIVRTIVQEITE